MRCPCRKKSESRIYADCCAPFHLGTEQAPAAEVLMRSRYAAFALENAAYLIETWHPSTRPAGITFNPGEEWLLLRVLATHTAGESATVEFIARSRSGGQVHLLHEISRFVRDNGFWFYLDGVIKP